MNPLYNSQQLTSLYDYPKFWAECFEPAPFLPTSREQMDALGWDSCDVIVVTGDAYVDHPSFGMAIIGRLLESQGFRVGIIAQPDWNSAEPFKVLGKPNLYFGVTAGNMDSMINRYTADRKIRSDDAYSPDNQGNLRPDRASLIYTQRCREAFKGVPVVLGGIEGSLRRIAHYDYWQDKVRRSILVDSKADILLYGNAERAIVEITHRLSRGEPIDEITNVRGTAYVCKQVPEDYFVIDSTQIDRPGRVEPPKNPYVMETDQSDAANCAKKNAEENASDSSGDSDEQDDPNSNVQFLVLKPNSIDRDKTVIRLPAFKNVEKDPVLYAHANRILHLETNPGNARALMQKQGEQRVWLNPPAIPLSTQEMDFVFDLPYARVPHPQYGDKNIPAYEMIRFSVNIMRGCFGGCTFCSITEHEGRIIQNRSEDSILREVEKIRDNTPGFTGVISDLGGPTANMYRLACKSPEIEKACRKPSCVYPGICQNLNTDHKHLTQLYRKARSIDGVKKILVSSGLRYDLAVKDPEYVKELVTHHVGGYLKIAPEHTEEETLSKMMKPGIGAYEEFKHLFEKFSKEAGKKQYLIPYFIAAHPGTRDIDMMNLAIWLKANGFRADQVQTFYPSPMATATAMYHSAKNPLRKVSSDSENVVAIKGEKQRRLHKAFLRYHDPNNWPLLRDALKKMGRSDLIGNGKHHLIPKYQPSVDGSYQSARRKNSTKRSNNPSTFKQSRTSASKNSSRNKQPKRGTLLTQHTGLPPRETGSAKKK